MEKTIEELSPQVTEETIALGDDEIKELVEESSEEELDEVEVEQNKVKSIPKDLAKNSKIKAKTLLAIANRKQLEESVRFDELMRFQTKGVKTISEYLALFKLECTPALIEALYIRYKMFSPRMWGRPGSNPASIEYLLKNLRQESYRDMWVFFLPFIKDKEFIEQKEALMLKRKK